MTALLLSALLASLAGSLHCAGMCGPFTAFFAQPGARLAPGAAAYHAGRLAVYATFGAVAGGAGRAVEAAAAGRLRSVGALVAGLLLVAWGAHGLLRHAGLGLPALPVPATLRRVAVSVASTVRGRSPVTRGLPTGSVSCAHCGLPVPQALRRDDGPSWCCSGCETVAAMLASRGLDRFYELRDRSATERRRAVTTGRTYEEMDDPGTAVRCVPCGGGAATIDLYLEGVHCAACVWLVEKLPALCDGVIEARLDFGRARARVTFDPARVRVSAIARTLDSLGYPVHPWREADRDAARRREDRALAVRLGVAGACAANAMMMAAAMYGGALTDMDARATGALRAASFVASLPSALWAALPFYRGAWSSLRRRMLHVDLPLSIAILAAFLGSSWHALRGGEVYFDSLTALVFLLLCARWLNRRATRAAENAADLLCALRPQSARRIESGRASEVPVATLREGDVVEVRASESLPADGVVIDGFSSVDASLLSGESRPLRVGPGDVVHAGTVNLQARIRLRVQGTGERTRLGRIAALVQEASLRRAPALRLVDRLAGRFVALVLALSAITLAAWWPISPERAFENALAMLIVTCPCVLAFATPLSLHVALGRAARRGLLVKGGDALQALERPGIVVLDKTGTITEGRLALVSWTGDDSARPLVRALETHSAHPVARALADGTWSSEPLRRADDVAQELGRGIRGRVGPHEVVVGTRELAEEHCGPLPAWAREELARLGRAGITAVTACVDGRVTAIAGLADPVRDGAAAAVSALRARGWTACILSGDDPAVVRRVAEELSIPPEDARGGAPPEAKVRAVEEWKARGPVLMVGDGVNDAAALAAADVGLAVHGGAEASLAAADAFTTRPGLEPVVELVDGARRLSQALRVNAVVSIGYNAIGAGLCLAGLIDPLAAALLMPASSLTVTAVAVLWPTFSRRLPWKSSG